MQGMSGPQGSGGLQAGAPGTFRNPTTMLLYNFCCAPYGIYQLYQLEGELKRYLGRAEGPSILWFLFTLIPLLGMPKLIGEARAKAGTATQGDGSLIMYLLLGMYMIPKDANEVWEKLGVLPPK